VAGASGRTVLSRGASRCTVQWQASSELSRLRPKCLVRLEHPNAQDANFFFPDVAYLDDILVFSRDEETHRKHVRAVLTRVRDTGLTLKASKCEFHAMETEYLGYVISPERPRMNEEKIRTIRNWKEPTNVKGVQSFLGFANFYRRFIRDYSKITTSLSSLTRKYTLWEWGDKQQEAFEMLKGAMITEPILQHLDPEQPVTIETDASDYAIGAIC